jgi:hypothetical protein
MLPKQVKKSEPLKAAWANNVVQSLRSLDRRRKGQKQYSGSNPSGGTSNCPFGKIIKFEGDSYILGGMIYCGDKNFTVPDEMLTLTSDSTKLYYFDITCTANTDDDGEIFLPGMETSTWTVSWETTSGSTYPDNTSPSIASGVGNIIIPIGKVTIKDGVASFQATGCGNVTVEHCAGTLSFTRA